MDAARILIVEDESIVAKDIQNSLKGMGYEVVGIVASGTDAVLKAAELNPDLILMDVMLRGEMDGIEAAKQIHLKNRIPVIYLTAYTDDNTFGRAKVSEAYGYLLKPFEDRELRTTIEMGLYKHTMERKLRESREWLETTLHCISDAVIATDLDRVIQFINPIAQQLTDWKQSEALGHKLTDVFNLMKEHQLVSVDGELTRILKDGTAIESGKDYILLAREGRQTSIEFSASPIRGDDSRIFGVVLTFRDITERKNAEDREKKLQDRLFRYQRMESLGALAGGVASDLNNILGPMVSYPDLIAGKLTPENPARKDLEIIKNSARKAVDVIRDLLTLGRIGHFPMAPVPLNRLLEDILKNPAFQSLQAGAPLIRVELSLGADLPPVLGSESHLQELVLNLFINAFESMPEGGRITVSTSHQNVSSPIAGYENIDPGQYVVLHVMDSGHGLDERDLNRLFEPFSARKTTNSKSGTGLGLAVVYGVVKEHKGFIDVKSKVKEGTDFVVYFPVTGAAPAATVKAEPVDFRGNESILVVDDDEEQRMVAARWLRSIGYKVVTAPNGREAVSMLEETARANSGEIDLVLLDMIMGDDFDGLDTYRKMLEINSAQKAVAVSGFVQTERIKEAMRLGAGQYLQKPYTVDELAKAVRAELDKTVVRT